MRRQRASPKPDGEVVIKETKGKVVIKKMILDIRRTKLFSCAQPTAKEHRRRMSLKRKMFHPTLVSPQSLSFSALVKNCPCLQRAYRENSLNYFLMFWLMFIILF